MGTPSTRLTSRHVTGPAGTPISTILRGTQTLVGRAGTRSLTRAPFQEVYPDFTAQRTYLTLDAGLIEVDDVAAWTSQTYGLPPVGELADLSEHNIGTRLVGAQVIAFGAASGLLQGRIAALFFRYKSLGGYDDVTDFLIAPSPGTPGSQPGDSGTVWHLRQTVTDDSARTVMSPYSQPPSSGPAGPLGSGAGAGTGTRELLHPIALQWGGQNLTGTPAGANGFNFALAASLTNVLRLLEVDLVVAHNTHAQPFWGKTGHYTIASLACDQVKDPMLKELMAANSDRISFHLSELDPKHVNDATVALKNNPRFIPLADVPDLVWKNLPKTVPGGRDTAFRAGPEHPTHYADIDQPRPADGKTLRQICVTDPTQVSVAAWQDYYTALGHTASKQRGLLPFRVWQLFDEMVDAAANGDTTRFVCAAGLVAHYVGDASQPLHGSFMADGIDATPTSPSKGQGVHSAYESDMVDAFSNDITTGLHTALTRRGPRRSPIASGHDAAVAVVRLMDRTAKTIPPLDLVDAFAQTQIGHTGAHPTVTKTVLAALWQQFGAGTITIMADATRTLTAIWDAAFTTGQGAASVPAGAIIPISQNDLQHLYQDPAFLPSLDLDHIAAILK
jgi:hypothetical protein